MCVRHPRPLFTWTRKPQKAEPTTRVCVHVADFWQVIQGNRSGRLNEGKQRRWENQPKVCHQAGFAVDSGHRPCGTLCGAVQHVPRSGPP